MFFFKLLSGDQLSLNLGSSSTIDHNVDSLGSIVGYQISGGSVVAVPFQIYANLRSSLLLHNVSIVWKSLGLIRFSI